MLERHSGIHASQRYSAELLTMSKSKVAGSKKFEWRELPRPDQRYVTVARIPTSTRRESRTGRDHNAISIRTLNSSNNKALARA